MDYIQKFDFHSFISEICPEHTELDVFDEIRQDDFLNRSRQFSFSIPDDSDFKVDEELNSLLSTSKTALFIDPPITSEEDTSNYTFFYETDDEQEALIMNDIQSSLTFPKTELLLSSKNDKVFYKMPSKSAKDVYTIWKAARIPRAATRYNIEILLLDWAHTHATLEIVDKRIAYIKWKSVNNSICEATWSAFLKWFLCATIDI